MVRAAGDWWLDGEPIPRANLVHELTELLFSGLAANLERPAT